MKNEKGLALIELLAAISILFIISSVIYGVFFSFNNNYKQISEKSSMDQTANIVMATIKQYHLKYDTYEISYDSQKQEAFIEVNDSKTRLGDESIKMQLKLGDTELSPLTIIDSHKPLAIQMILTNKSGKSYEVETIIKRY